MSAEVIRLWFFNQMMSSMEDPNVPEEFKTSVMGEAITNERLATFIDVQPRALFDVFDDNGIIISVGYHENFGFNYAVGDINDQQHYFKTRKEAEYTAIEIAFQILEEQLSPIDLPKLDEN